MADGYAPEPKEIPLLLTIFKLYEQQKYMYDNKIHSVENRIVSISQPWIRSIVRGKLNAPVEFGAKERTGHYPERVLADQIYRTRAICSYCKEHGIRLSVFVANLFKLQRRILCTLFYLYKILREKTVWLSLSWA